MREELLKEYAEEALKNGPHRFIRPDDKVFYIDGFKDGYNLGLKAKINMTTISDAPALPEADEDYKISIAKEAWDAVNICTPYHPESFVQGYIAGAEPREKRIAELEEKLANADYQLEGRDLEIQELEKENAELKEEINKIAFARGNLEEENAELKGLKDVATLIRANNDTVTTLMQLNNMLVSKNQQLTKTKDLLKKVADVCGYPNYDIPVVLYSEIAEFLKDSEVEK